MDILVTCPKRFRQHHPEVDPNTGRPLPPATTATAHLWGDHHVEKTYSLADSANTTVTTNSPDNHLEALGEYHIEKTFSRLTITPPLLIELPKGKPKIFSVTTSKSTTTTVSPPTKTKTFTLTTGTATITTSPTVVRKRTSPPVTQLSTRRISPPTTIARLDNGSIINHDKFKWFAQGHLTQQELKDPKVWQAFLAFLPTYAETATETWEPHQPWNDSNPSGPEQWDQDASLDQGWTDATINTQIFTALTTRSQITSVITQVQRTSPTCPRTKSLTDSPPSHQTIHDVAHAISSIGDELQSFARPIRSPSPNLQPLATSTPLPTSRPSSPTWNNWSNPPTPSASRSPSPPPLPSKEKSYVNYMNPPQFHPTPNSPAPTWSNWPKLTKRQKRQGSKWSTSPDSEGTEVAHKHSTSDPTSPSQPKPDLVEASPTQSVDTTTSEDNGPTATDVMLSCIHLGLLAAQRKARNPDGEKDLPFSAKNFEENYDNPWQQHQQILNDAI